jgi:signal transduction histidine kinase
MRIERDLHDGAQQRLVTLALSLRAVSERATSSGDDRLAAQVEASRHQLSQALVELRELARGIQPAILTQEGLEAAVSLLGERAPLPVKIEMCLERRLAPEGRGDRLLRGERGPDERRQTLGGVQHLGHRVAPERRPVP